MSLLCLSGMGCTQSCPWEGWNYQAHSENTRPFQTRCLLKISGQNGFCSKTCVRSKVSLLKSCGLHWSATADGGKQKSLQCKTIEQTSRRRNQRGKTGKHHAHPWLHMNGLQVHEIFWLLTWSHGAIPKSKARTSLCFYYLQYNSCLSFCGANQCASIFQFWGCTGNEKECTL